ncbi:MAG: tetratricopeptide repeat protein [Candidatus Aureabacteria bacterium]|nr:tetratricopeptide repeat protein [Candidatus Auribacterota bacterium]
MIKPRNILRNGKYLLLVLVVFIWQKDCLSKQKYTEEEKRGIIIECYENGVREYQSGNYSAAKSEFDRILKLDPDNKKARRYAVKCDEKIETENVEKHDEPAKTAGSGEAAAERAPAREVEEKIIAADTPFDAQKSGAEPEETSEEVTLPVQTTRLMDEGVNSYRDGEYGKAKEIFGQILSLDSSNKKAKRYIKRCEDKIAKKEKLREKELAREEKEKERKKALEEKIALEKKNKQLPPPVAVKEEAETPAGSTAVVSDDKDAGALYKEALLEYRKQNYRKAIEMFKEVLQRDPGNEKASGYIKAAERKL